MGPLQVLKDITARLNQANIEYFLVGSLAAMYYGRPRFTNDVDLVVRLRAIQSKSFEALFDIEDYYCPPHEVIADEIIRSGSFNLIHQASGIKVDLVVMSHSAFNESEFARRKLVRLLPDLEAYIASPEDVIIKKLDFYRQGGSEKHLTDIKSMLTETQVDDTYLQNWITKLGLAEQWKKI